MNIESLEEKLKEFDVTPYLNFRLEHEVKVIYIENPRNFYVRLTRYTPFVEYIENLKLSVKATIMRGQIVLFNFNNCLKYARGRIMSDEDDDNTYDILAIDYGFIERNVHTDRIWECHNLLASIYPVAVNCKLNSCVMKGDTWGDATKVFKSEAEGRVGIMSIRGQANGTLIIDLFIDGPTDISSHLALLDLTLLTLGSNLNTYIRKLMNTPTYIFKDLKVDVPIHVRVVAGKSIKEFYVAEINIYKAYLDCRETITHFSKKEPHAISVRKGDIVAVKQYLNMYERGIVKEVVDFDNVRIHLVDLGRTEVVHVLNLRKLPARFMTMPVVAIYCACHSDLKLDTRLLLHPGNDFYITIKELGSRFETPHIVEVEY